MDRVTKKRYHELGVEAALEEVYRLGQPVKYTNTHKTDLASIVYGPRLAGRKH